jgi:hypothetical protein
VMFASVQVEGVMGQGQVQGGVLVVVNYLA